MQSIKYFYGDQDGCAACVLFESDQALITIQWRGPMNDAFCLQYVLDYALQSTRQLGIHHWMWDFTQVENDIDANAHLITQTLQDSPIFRQVDQCAVISQQDHDPQRQQLSEFMQAKGAQVKLFASQVKALDWLLVPDVQDAVWEQVPELQF